MENSNQVSNTDISSINQEKKLNKTWAKMPVDSSTNYYSPRKGSIARLKTLIQKEKSFFMLRAPSGSGKTSLCKLLKEDLEKENNYYVLNLSFSELHSSFQNLLEDTTQSYLKTKGIPDPPKTFEEFAQFSEKPIILIIDEIQAGYEDKNFWSCIKNLHDSPLYKLQSVVGVGTYDTTVSPGVISPVQFNPKLGIDYICLSKSETWEIFRDFNENNSFNLTISESVSKLIYSVTNGHGEMISLIGAKLEEIYCKQASKERFVIDETIWNQFIWQYFFATISNSRLRSLIVSWFNHFPESHEFLLKQFPEITGLTLKGTWNSSIIDTNPDIKNLIRAGILVPIKNDQLKFSSYTIYLLCLEIIFATNSSKPSEFIFQNVVNLMFVCIPLMNSNFLSRTESTISGEWIPTEYVFQREFYAVVNKFLPYGKVIDCEVRKPNNKNKKRKINETIEPNEEMKEDDSTLGRIDFLIRNGAKWGIEFCVNKNHGEVLEYCRSFSTRFKHIEADQKLVVNFCTPQSFPIFDCRNNMNKQQFFLYLKDNPQGTGKNYPLDIYKLILGPIYIDEQSETKKKEDVSVCEQFKIAKKEGVSLFHCILSKDFTYYLFVWIDVVKNQLCWKKIEAGKPEWNLNQGWELFPLHKIPAYSTEIKIEPIQEGVTIYRYGDANKKDGIAKVPDTFLKLQVIVGVMFDITQPILLIKYPDNIFIQVTDINQVKNGSILYVCTEEEFKNLKEQQQFTDLMEE